MAGGVDARVGLMQSWLHQCEEGGEIRAQPLDVWKWVEEGGATPASVGAGALSTLRERMDQGGENGARAAGIYLAMIAVGGTGVYALADTAALLMALRLTRGCFALSPAERACLSDSTEEENIDMMEVDDGSDIASNKDGFPSTTETKVQSRIALGHVCVKCIQLVFENLTFEGNTEILKAAASALSEVPALYEALAGFVKESSDSVGRDSFSVLESLVNSRHGSIIDTGAVVLRTIAPFLLKSTSSTALRKDIVLFVEALMRSHGLLVEPAVGALIRHLCMCSPERASEREQVIGTISKLFFGLSEGEQSSFGRFLYRLSRTQKSKYRALAVEVAALLLKEIPGPDEVAADCNPAEGAKDSAFSIWGSSCLCLLIQRSSDKANNVRGKALNHLGDALRIISAVPSWQSTLEFICVASSPERRGMFTGGYPATTPRINFAEYAEQDRTEGEDEGEGLVTAPSTLLQTEVGPGASPLELMAPSEDVGDLLIRRCADESAAVRKASLSALGQLLGTVLLESDWPANAVMTLSDGCRDHLLTVRRAALNSLSELVCAHPDKKDIVATWITAALPLAMDLEPAVADRTVSWVREILLDPLLSADYSTRMVAISLLAEIEESGTSHVALETAIIRGGKSGNIDCHFISPIEKLVSESPSSGLWMLLSMLAVSHSGKLKWKTLYNEWLTAQKANAQVEEDTGYVIKCIASSASHFSAATAKEIADSVGNRLMSMKLNPAVVGIHVDAFTQLTNSVEAKNGEQKNKSLSSFDHFSSTIYTKAIELLTKAIVEQRSFSGSVDAKRACTILYSISEISLQTSIKTPDNLVTLVQALLADKGAGGFSIPSMVQAHAWVALGKLCVSDQKLAKRCLPLFIQQLGYSSSPAVRNNIVVVLGDLCMKYTSMVDAHLGRIAACLGDSCELVRKQTLLLLSNLLSRDYVKWRGPLLHRFWLALVDPSAEVRQIAEFTFGGGTSASAPFLAYNHFLEAVMVLNGRWVEINAVEGSAVAPLSVEEQQKCTIPDEANRPKRRHIYLSLLAHMTPEQRVATVTRICSDLLGKFGREGNMSIVEDCELLLDGLAILCLPEAKPVSGKSTVDDSEIPEAGNKQAVAAAKRKMLIELSKRSLMEVIVPTLVDLKLKLSSEHSPFVSQVMQALCAQLRDRQKELPTLLPTEPQLLKEIQYDIREAERLAKLAKTPAPNSKGTRINAIVSPVVMVEPLQAIENRSPLIANNPTPPPPTLPHTAKTPAKSTTPGGRRRSSIIGIVNPAMTPAAALVLGDSPTAGSPASRLRSRTTPNSSLLKQHAANTTSTPNTGSLTVPRLRRRVSLADEIHEEHEPSVVPLPIQSLEV